jgi:uncharacterized spore protein YtfJ
MNNNHKLIIPDRRVCSFGLGLGMGLGSKQTAAGGGGGAAAQTWAEI